MARRTIPELVAHRGYPRRYPENSLAGLEAALRAGARFVEFDVHLAADAVPVVVHDADLMRTAGVSGRVAEMTTAQLAAHDVPALGDVVRLLEAWPGVVAFVEIKRAAVRASGRERVVAQVAADLAPIRDRAVIISFDAETVAMARRESGHAIGWIVERPDEGAAAAARALEPEYLFVDREILPGDLWPGPWRWAVYTVDDPTEALALAARDVDLVETDAIGDMLSHPELRRGR